MKKFKIPFVKAMYVRGYKIFEGETKEEAVAAMNARIRDNDNPLMTSEVTWGDPQYEEDSFESEIDDELNCVEEVTEPEFTRNIHERYEVPVGATFPLDLIPPKEGMIKAIADHRGLGGPRCMECAAHHASICGKFECAGNKRKDNTSVRFVTA